MEGNRSRVWLRHEDLIWFIESLVVEIHSSVPEPMPLGLRWREGDHTWLATWLQNGEPVTEHAYVLPFSRLAANPGTKVPIDQSVFQEKKAARKKQFVEKVISMGFPPELLHEQRRS